MTLPQHTRAWKIRGSGPDDGSSALHWEEAVPLPKISEGDVVVKFHAWSINYPELAIANGTFPWLPKKVPEIPGSDAAGEIIGVGKNVRDLKVGDRVFPIYYPFFESGMAPNEETSDDVPGLLATGVLCEYVVFNERKLAKAPHNLSYEETASLVCSGLTAWNALYGLNPIKPGSWVLVQGTGGVSMYAIKFALAAGASVVATTSSDAKADSLKHLGVQHVLNYKEDSTWGETARALTPRGLGFDHIIEVGGQSTIKQSFKAVARGGSIDVIGFLSGHENDPDAPSCIQPLLNACIVRGVEVGSREQVREMVKAIEAQNIKPVLDHVTFTLHELPEVYKRVWAGKHTGKAVISGIDKTGS
ncbi:hypothetical protein NW762_005487 [Fusarium torreyae]|uniref:Enoyl reductase (ER) domain-containing protein n=1 Tax=Fusarium torreyae TaxID=1237075 RepID=A0A9W8VG66_9HYPO|nr:hypothetical protein NW762_005487 [Fusarium torreyae]